MSSAAQWRQYIRVHNAWLINANDAMSHVYAVNTSSVTHRKKNLGLIVASAHRLHRWPARRVQPKKAKRLWSADKAALRLLPSLSSSSPHLQFRSDTKRLHRRPSSAEAEPMMAPATLSLRPCAAPAPPRIALPRARAWFASAAGASPGVAASHPPRRLCGLRRAVAIDSDQQGSSEPPKQAQFPLSLFTRPQAR